MTSMSCLVSRTLCIAYALIVIDVSAVLSMLDPKAWCLGKVMRHNPFSQSGSFVVLVRILVLQCCHKTVCVSVCVWHCGLAQVLYAAHAVEDTSGLRLTNVRDST